jgi:hypothetical protein
MTCQKKVFTELGQVARAAIKLEDCTEDVAERIDLGWDLEQADLRQLGWKIKDARRTLAAGPPSATCNAAAA